MSDDLVELVEDESGFSFSGEAIGLIEPHGDIIFKRIDKNGIKSFLQKENVKGFYIDEQNPSKLYVSYDSSRKLFVGEVKDLQQASEWIAKVNSLYGSK